MIIEAEEDDRFEKGDTPPTEGGCWFCYEDSGEMKFDIEFDTYYHPECLEKTDAETILDYEVNQHE